jgi:hypothetical protein
VSTQGGGTVDARPFALDFSEGDRFLQFGRGKSWTKGKDVSTLPGRPGAEFPHREQPTLEVRSFLHALPFRWVVGFPWVVIVVIWSRTLQRSASRS